MNAKIEATIDCDIIYISPIYHIGNIAGKEGGYYESIWDDANSPKMASKGNVNSGAKPKQLIYNGEPVSCGTIYQLRNYKHLSDAEIGSLFDISESTVTRRRKKHISNGNFYDGSNIVF